MNLLVNKLTNTPFMLSNQSNITYSNTNLITSYPINIGLSTTLGLYNNWTCMAWIYWTGTSSRDYGIFGARNHSNGDHLNLTIRNYRLYHGHRGDDLNGSTISANTWVHVAFIYDRHQRIYMNETLRNSRSTGYYLGNANNHYIWIGVWYVDLARFFEGSMQYVYIFNTNLSQSTIQSYMNANIP